MYLGKVGETLGNNKSFMEKVGFKLSLNMIMDLIVDRKKRELWAEGTAK